jgi:hypothetical protein
LEHISDEDQSLLTLRLTDGGNTLASMAMWSADFTLTTAMMNIKRMKLRMRTNTGARFRLAILKRLRDSQHRTVGSRVAVIATKSGVRLTDSQSTGNGQ